MSVLGIPMYQVKTLAGLWRDVSKHEYEDHLGIKQIVHHALGEQTYDWELVRTDDGARLIENPNKTRWEISDVKNKVIPEMLAVIDDKYGFDSEESIVARAILQTATRDDAPSALTEEARKMADSLESSAKFYAEVAAEMNPETYEPDDPVDIQAGLENQAVTQAAAAKMIRALLAAKAPKGDGND